MGIYSYKQIGEISNLIPFLIIGIIGIIVIIVILKTGKSKNIKKLLKGKDK